MQKSRNGVSTNFNEPAGRCKENIGAALPAPGKTKMRSVDPIFTHP